MTSLEIAAALKAADKWEAEKAYLMAAAHHDPKSIQSWLDARQPPDALAQAMREFGG